MEGRTIDFHRDIYTLRAAFIGSLRTGEDFHGQATIIPNRYGRLANYSPLQINNGQLYSLLQKFFKSHNVDIEELDRVLEKPGVYFVTPKPNTYWVRLRVESRSDGMKTIYCRNLYGINQNNDIAINIPANYHEALEGEVQVISQLVREIVEKALISGYSVFISGASGSGKTTLLYKILLSYIEKYQQASMYNTPPSTLIFEHVPEIMFMLKDDIQRRFGRMPPEISSYSIVPYYNFQGGEIFRYDTDVVKNNTRMFTMALQQIAPDLSCVQEHRSEIWSDDVPNPFVEALNSGGIPTLSTVFVGKPSDSEPQVTAMNLIKKLSLPEKMDFVYIHIGRGGIQEVIVVENGLVLIHIVLRNKNFGDGIIHPSEKETYMRCVFTSQIAVPSNPLLQSAKEVNDSIRASRRRRS